MSSEKPSFDTLYKQFVSCTTPETSSYSYETSQTILPQLQDYIASTTFTKETPLSERLSFLQASRDILERAVLMEACKNGPGKRFECLYTQLYSFYRNSAQIAKAGVPASEKEYEIRALYLLYLLGMNETGSFHMSLESIPHNVVVENPCIHFCYELEELLTEGSYAAALERKDSLPAPSFRLFVASLTEAVRADVASCMEKAYESMSVEDARSMLFLPSSPMEDLGLDDPFLTIVRNRGWEVDGGKVTFENAHQVEDDNLSVSTFGLNMSQSMIDLTTSMSMSGINLIDEKNLPCYELIRKVTSYAKKLDQIV